MASDYVVAAVAYLAFLCFLAARLALTAQHQMRRMAVRWDTRHRRRPMGRVGKIAA